eukprot:m.552278 g.552278  ORF g.552278 m.552278 type:complete len:72 (-) comp57740_c1_seq3:926-1141(-)
MRCLLSGCLRPDCGLFFAFEVLLVGVVFLFLEAFRIKKSSTQVIMASTRSFLFRFGFLSLCVPPRFEIGSE